MKKFFKSLKTAAIALGCMISTQVSAQLIVNDGYSASDLANQIVGSGVTISNAQIDCAPGGYGVFSNGNTTNIGLNNGVLLTTGSIFEASGNASGNDASTDVSSSFHGDADLDALSGWSVQDACVLSFDFVSTSNQISLQYVFSSEEYNEYVCSQFNDIFGFFVSGPNPLGGNYVAQNVALVPSSSLPVAINTINNGTSGSNGSSENCLSLGNAAYFVSNSGGTTIEYDGFTVTLTATINIVPGETYNFKFAIADVSDGILDSGVFIKGSSFSVFLCQAGSLNFVSPNNGLICSNDDIADAISVSTTSIAEGDTYVFLLTSTTGEILAMNSTGNFDMSSYADGLYNVYGLSYSGVISEPTLGGNISDIDAASDEGCFELTSPLEFAKIECTEDPSLICPESTTIQCLSDVPAADPSSVVVIPSQCEVNASVTYNDMIEGNNCSGVVVRTYSVTDNCGNVGSCVQNIYYVDTEAPFLVSATENVTIECGQEDQIPSIEAGDYCDESVEITFVDENVVLDGCNSSFERHYTFVDNCGNAGQFVQYVSVGDNTSPVINGVEEYVHVQCIDDVPAAAEAFATDNCDDNVEVMSFGYDSGNKTSECVLSTAFGPGADWAFWAPTLFTEGYTSSNNFVFDANGGHFDQFADGKAHLYGTVVNTVNPNEKLEINMWFENAADWATWSSMGRNYKDDVNCATPGQLFQDWTYYEMVNDLSVAVGDGDLDGLLLQFQHMPANYYFGFQIGQGANNKNCGNGLSGWFEYTGFYNCEPIEGHGDINVDVECEPSEEQDLCNTDYTYVYSAVDASGNYNHLVQTIHIEDTFAPEFAFCPENYSVQCTSEVQAAPSLTATDNCSENVVVVALDEIISGNYPCDYVITRAWYAEDECGNRSYCTQEIAVKDETAPIFTFVPENITVECSDEVPAVNGQATDNCGDATVSYTDAFEGNSCYGVITRTFEAVDACGNTAYATQYITIVDTTAPVFDAYSMQIYVECDQIESLELLTATDNCNEVTVSFTELHNSGGCLGVLERTYTATDACGNSTTTVQYITITDTTAPTINTPADVTVECDNVPAFELPTAFDNCGEEVVVTGTEEILPGDCANSYTIVRHWVATDLCENVAESATTITVIDTTNPEWEYVPADINISCDQEVPAAEMAVAIDNCDDQVEVVMTQDTLAGSCPANMTIRRLYRAFDNCGNEIMAVQNINISDNNAPVWNEENVYELTFECTDVVAGVEPMATDNCSEFTIAVAETLYVEGPCYTSGAFIYTATDACGNVSAPFYQYYQILDTTAPVITGSFEIEKPCDDYAGVFISYEDNCNEVSVDYSDEHVSGGCQGRVIRTYYVADACQNVSTFQQYITLTDNVAPVVVEEPMDITVQCSDNSWTYFVPSFTDNCAEEVEVSVSYEYIPNGCLGAYVATWTATDNCGNSTTVDQTVTVIDTIDPEFEFVPESFTVECSQEFVLGDATATDDCSVAIVTVSEETLTGDCPNTYTLVRTFTATDNCGNTATATQTIDVVDTTAPVWNYESAPYELSFDCTEVAVSVEPVASDNCNEYTIAVAETLYVQGPCYTSGAFIFTATDACGNVSAPFYQYYTIVDTTAPVVVGTVEIERPCTDYMGTYIEATDNCNTFEIEFVDEHVSGGCQGRIIRDYTVTDLCGNASTFQQIITLTDEIAPVAEVLPENLVIECTEEVPGFIPVWSDNCDDELELTAISSIALDGCTEYISRSWTATDNCGNSTTISQMITIVDTQAPMFDGDGYSMTVNCDEEWSVETPYAWDACHEVTVAEDVETIAGNCEASYTEVHTFIATDECGNESAPFVVTVNVVDNTAPEFTFVPSYESTACSEWNGFEMATATDACSEVTVTFVDSSEPFNSEGESGDCGDLLTYSAGGWGAPNGTAANYRDENFASAFPNGLTVGCNGNTYHFTSAQAIENFLPAGGPASVISGNTENPTGIQNQLANQLVASVLALGFDAYDANFAASSASLADAVYNSGDFEGMSVAQVITLANQALGGCSNQYSLGSLAEALAMLNLNFDAGVNNGHLSCGGESICGTLYTRVWTATDACGNVATATSSAIVYDNVAPEFDGTVSNVTVECASEIPAFVELTATDACGTATVVRSEEVVSADDCGNQVIEVSYVATDNCGNVATTSYTITVNDVTAPVLSETPANLVLSCEEALPVAPEVTAMDNCNGEVEVMYTETYVGEQPEEGSIADCDLLTPALPAGNSCGYPTAWAMVMFNMPSAHRYYAVQSAELVQFANGTAHLVGTLVNTYNANAGFNVDVWFNNGMDWASWSNQSFPTGFKADCGGEAANHEDWFYYLLVNGDGAELTGWGQYAGSAINLSHAPSSNYFGFQLGDGANNYNGADNGFGGWFSYNGTFVNGTSNAVAPSVSNVNGGGDFAFELDCCPDYSVVRCWTSMDCSGNVVEYCQTISWEGSSNNGGSIQPVEPISSVEAAKEAMLAVYPNPAVDQATFVFKAAETGKSTIEIYDLAGSRVAMIYQNVVEAGNEYKTTYDASNLATGVYMYRMTNGNTTEMGRLIINK